MQRIISHKIILYYAYRIGKKTCTYSGILHYCVKHIYKSKTIFPFNAIRDSYTLFDIEVYYNTDNYITDIYLQLRIDCYRNTILNFIVGYH